MALRGDVAKQVCSPNSSDIACDHQFTASSACRCLAESTREETSQPEPVLLFRGGFELNSLTCDEDGSSLGLPGPEQRTSTDVAVPLVKRPVFAFDPDGVRDVIRNELATLQELRYSPESGEARQFLGCNRPRVVSWIVQAVSALDLSKETLHSAVSLLDRYITGTEAHPPEPVLQLLALGCLSVAAKHEEVAQRSSDHWISLAVDVDGRTLYERLDLHRMEWLLMETVEWRIRVPNTFTFLCHYHTALASCGAFPDNPIFAASFKACYEFMSEISMLYSEFLPFGHSTCAVACLTLADWYCRGAIALGQSSPPATPETVPYSPPARNLVSELEAFVGLDASYLAPDLGRCVEALNHLYRLVADCGPWGGRQSEAAELGLLAPVVARYQPTSKYSGN